MALLGAGSLSFPEGPRWRDGVLWCSDIFARRVLQVAETGDVTVVAELADSPSGIGFLPDGTALVVSMQDRLVLRIEAPRTGRGTGRTSTYADLRSIPCQAVNDMVVDGRGRAYVGARARKPNHRTGAPEDAIILVHDDGSVGLAWDRLVSPNGICISPDGRSLVVAETHACRLTEFDVADDGGLSDPRCFADLGSSMPDGIALDAEGAVWVGVPQDRRFLRVRRGGEVVEVHHTDERWAVACTLGGPERRTLYCATSKTSMESLFRRRDENGQPYPAPAGVIETVEVDVPGAGWP